MKVAVIGGGPAAFGALSRLIDLKEKGLDLEIDVFTDGKADQEQKIAADYKPVYSSNDVNEILKAGKAYGSAIALPPRSFHKQALKDHQGANLKTDIKVSETFGGIGNYWSGSVFPTHAINDPIASTLGDLTPHYSFIADRIPVSGQSNDELKSFFDESSIHYPPIPLAEQIAKLKCAPDLESDGLALAIGTNRIALNSRPEERNGCIQCGDCMYGCPRDALFRAAKSIFSDAESGHCHIVFESVLTVKPVNKMIQLTTLQNTYMYDKVFVCTGALGSVQLLGRSYGPPINPIHLYDNKLWYFPAISFLPKRTLPKGKHFAFAELSGGIFDHANQTYNHLLVSTLPEAAIDNMIGRSRLSRFMSKLISNHLIIGAMYGSHEEYIRYNFEQIGDTWKAVSATSSTDGIDDDRFALFKNHLARHGWYTSRRLVMENGTSGHYSANLGEAYDIENLARTGAFDYNVFVCDSSSWNAASMSQQHTFTVMANASRIAQAAFSHLDD